MAIKADQMSATPSTPTDGTSFRIEGGTGNDKLWGGRGKDVINGGAGNDFLYGEGGKDLLNGGGQGPASGQGTLKGGGGSDFIDALFGDEGSKSIVSHLFGGAGNDRFVTGNGAKEIIDCGSGSDQVTWTCPPGTGTNTTLPRATTSTVCRPLVTACA